MRDEDHLMAAIWHEGQQALLPFGVFAQALDPRKWFGLDREGSVWFAEAAASLPALSGFAGFKELVCGLGDCGHELVPRWFSGYCRDWTISFNFLLRTVPFDQRNGETHA